MSTQTHTQSGSPETPNLKPQSSLQVKEDTGIPRTAEVPPLKLPEPPKASDASQNVEVGGKAVKLASLGPMVVNKDGTLSRISNWMEMGEIEKANTVRILAKRNMLRLQDLKENGQQN